MFDFNMANPFVLKGDKLLAEVSGSLPSVYGLGVGRNSFLKCMASLTLYGHLRTEGRFTNERR